jgi:DNA-binding GntR family transcriptional regulator
MLRSVPLNHRTKPQIVSDELRSRIIDGRLAPGQRIVLRQIASELGCSEIPIREALTSLASQGLIRLVPHGGTYVSDVDGQALLELSELRLLLEPAATCQAAAVMPVSALPKLFEMVEYMGNLAKQNDAAAYGLQNREFHETILAHCPNRRLAILITQTRDQAERGRAVYRLPAHMDQSSEQHRQIVELIASRDIDKLHLVCVEHCRHVLVGMQSLLASASLLHGTIQAAASSGNS